VDRSARIMSYLVGKKTRWSESQSRLRELQTRLKSAGYFTGAVDRFATHTLDKLARRGHRLTIADGWSLGRLCAASSAGGVIKAAATPRHMEAYAIGR
jgi:hypothetical protein